MKITLTENDLWCSGHPSLDTPSIFNFKTYVQDLFHKADAVEYVRADGQVVVLKDRKPLQHTHKFTLEVEVVCPVGPNSVLTITRQEVINSLVDASYAVSVKNSPEKLTASMFINRVTVVGTVASEE
jgi:hypothetical protein